MHASSTTLPRLLVEQAKRRPDRCALREKEWGVWQSRTWRDYHDTTAAFAAGMAELGLGKSDIVVLIGDNRPEWLFAELAIQALGGMALGLYQDAPAEEIAYVFELTQARLVVAEDQEQVDKILSIRPGLPSLAHIVFHDDKGLSGYDVPGLLAFEKVCDMGLKRSREFAGWVQAASPDDPCLIATTSGTTGRPKLAMLSHRNLLSMAHNLGRADPKKPTDEFVSFLPLAWMGEQMMSVASALLFGFCVNFPEEPDTVQEDIREIGPHVIFSPPRVWENLAATVRVRIMETTPFKRWVFNALMPVGEARARAAFEKRPVSLGLGLADWVARWVLFYSLKDQLGFSNVRSASTGGGGPGAGHLPLLPRPGGQPEADLRSDRNRRHLLHPRGQRRGLHLRGQAHPGNPGGHLRGGRDPLQEPGRVPGVLPRTRRPRPRPLTGGWLRSGDAGYFDDQGRLVVIDRLKDVMRLSGGTSFSPQFVENKLKFSPFIKEAVALGRDRAAVAAIVVHRRRDRGPLGRIASDHLHHLPGPGRQA